MNYYLFIVSVGLLGVTFMYIKQLLENITIKRKDIIFFQDMIQHDHQYNWEHNDYAAEVRNLRKIIAKRFY